MRLPRHRSAPRTLAAALALSGLSGGPALPACHAVDFGWAGAIAELPWAARVADVDARLLRSDATTPVAAVAWMADALPPVETPPRLLDGLPRRADWRLSLHWPLADAWSFGLVPGVAVDADVYGRRFPGGTLAVVLGRTWTSRWRSFIDVAGDRLAVVRGDGLPLSLDAGLSYIASPAMQFDFALTHGLASAAAPVSAGLGIVAKF